MPSDELHKASAQLGGGKGSGERGKWRCARHTREASRKRPSVTLNVFTSTTYSRHTRHGLCAGLSLLTSRIFLAKRFVPRSSIIKDRVLRDRFIAWNADKQTFLLLKNEWQKYWIWGKLNTHRCPSACCSVEVDVSIRARPASAPL